MFPYYIAAIIYLTNGPLPAYLDGCVFDGWVVVLASTLQGDEHERSEIPPNAASLGQPVN